MVGLDLEDQERRKELELFLTLVGLAIFQQRTGRCSQKEPPPAGHDLEPLDESYCVSPVLFCKNLR